MSPACLIHPEFDGRTKPVWTNCAACLYRWVTFQSDAYLIAEDALLIKKFISPGIG